jgi:hypothetical protein
MKIAQFIVRTILAIIFLVILYHFALNGRYQAVGDSPYLIDKWTNTVSMPKNWVKFTKEVNKLNNNTSTEEQQTDEHYEE